MVKRRGGHIKGKKRERRDRQVAPGQEKRERAR